MSLLLLTLCYLLSSSVAFYYEDCGPQDAVVRFADVSFQPEPLVFGEKVAIAATMQIKDELRGGISKIEMHRLIKVFGITIPVAIPCAWGSCTRELCRDLSIGTLPCEWMRQSNVSCGCPIGPETIKSNDFTITLPSLRSFYSLFLNGLYRIRWTWMDTDEREIGCVTADFSLASKKSSK